MATPSLCMTSARGRCRDGVLLGFSVAAICAGILGGRSLLLQGLSLAALHKAALPSIASQPFVTKTVRWRRFSLDHPRDQAGPARIHAVAVCGSGSKGRYLSLACSGGGGVQVYKWDSWDVVQHYIPSKSERCPWQAHWMTPGLARWPAQPAATFKAFCSHARPPALPCPALPCPGHVQLAPPLLHPWATI